MKSRKHDPKKHLHLGECPNYIMNNLPHIDGEIIELDGAEMMQDRQLNGQP